MDDTEIGNNSFDELRDPADFNAGYGVSVVVVVFVVVDFFVSEGI